MGHWPKLYRLFPTLIVCSSGSIMFGLVRKYIGNKETKGCHKRWLKLWLKDRGGEALSYEGFSDCVIVSVTELLVCLVEWSQVSGKHFSMCEESLIPRAEDGFTTSVCGPRNHSQLAPAGHTELQMLCTSKLFKYLLMCCVAFQKRQVLLCFAHSVHLQVKFGMMHKYVLPGYGPFVKNTFCQI